MSSEMSWSQVAKGPPSPKKRGSRNHHQRKPARQTASNSTNATSLAIGVVEKVINYDSKKTGALIGRKGIVVQEMQRKSGARIVINSKTASAVITGNAEQVGSP